MGHPLECGSIVEFRHCETRQDEKERRKKKKKKKKKRREGGKR